LLQDHATSHHHCDVQNLVQGWGWEVLALPLYSPDLAPYDYWLFACVKEHLWGQQLKLEDDNTAGTASLCCLTKDEYRAAGDHLPRRWEKCVDSAGDYVR
jgi:transposase